MDFGTLLHVAKKNNESTKNSESKYYSTKFSAPKKEAKEKALSDNIKKFLAKKEQEEREKARIERENRERLLASRDEKSKNKIKKMLKVIKSANKSVLEDAVDTENTAVTLQGPDQPDEDDYGYVSTEAAAFYKKYMDKVKSLPEENKFAPSRPQSRIDLSGTKDRVKAAILKEQEDKLNPIKSKSSKATQSSNSTSTTVNSMNSLNSHSTSRRKDLYDSVVEKEIEEKRRDDERKQVKLKKSSAAAPPPLDFHQLLKLAEKKQHEPVEIVVETKKEPERLLTKKEKKELEERQRYLEERERRKKERKDTAQNQNKSQLVNGKIPKISESSKKLSCNDKNVSNQKISSSSSNPSLTFSSSKDSKDNNKKLSAPHVGQLQSQKISSSNGIKNRLALKTSADHKNNNLPANEVKQKMQGLSNSNNSNNGNNSKPYNVPSSTNSTTKMSSSKVNVSKSSISITKPTSALKANYDGPTRQFPPKETSAAQVKKPLPSERDRNIKPRQFPPPDVQRSKQPPLSSAKHSKGLKKPQKRRILDDDEDEYDSEMDDFIDDGPEENQNYSSYIKEIFGYDKSKYRYADDDDDAMESSFAQQMKEEYVSKKIGIMEDLEDMRLEAEEKRQKALTKKRKLK